MSDKKQAPIKAILIGAGYWGQNIIRNLKSNPNYNLVKVIEPSAQTRAIVLREYGIECEANIGIDDLQQVFTLAIISSPPETHLSNVVSIVKNVSAILITKPCGSNMKEAQQILKVSQANRVSVYVDFTYEFNPLFGFLINYPGLKEGSICDITSYRTSLGKFQESVSVLGDLAVHDIYIILRLMKFKMPSSFGLLSDKTKSSAFCVLEWDSDVRAWIHVSWKSPKKIRHFNVVSKSEALIVEELNLENPFQIITWDPNGASHGETNDSRIFWRGLGLKRGSLTSPDISPREALKNEFDILYTMLQRAGSTSSEFQSFFPTVEHAIVCWQVIESLEKGQKNEI